MKAYLAWRTLTHPATLTGFEHLPEHDRFVMLAVHSAAVAASPRFDVLEPLTHEELGELDDRAVYERVVGALGQAMREAGS